MRTIKDLNEDEWNEDDVVLYSFFPLFDDQLELSDTRKETFIRLMNWMLQTIDIKPEEFMRQIKKDIPRES